MRIIIDIQSLQTDSKYRGIGNYSLALVKKLLEVNKKHEIMLLANYNSDEDLTFIHNEFDGLFNLNNLKVFQCLENTKEILASNLPDIIISEKIRAHFIDSLNPDFVLVMSLFEGCAQNFVCSISEKLNYKVGVIGYDLIPLIDESKYLGDPRIKAWFYRKIESLKNADYIFSISESSKAEFERYLSVPIEKLFNISSACDDTYHEVTDNAQKAVSDFPIARKYILYSGACDERKNLHGLLSAYSQLPEGISNKYQIVLVGRYDEDGKRALTTLATNLNLNDDALVYTGFISNQALKALYHECRVFVFPSFHEGFGLPVLEAMTCGAPTICSNTSSLPEVIGLEEAMFDPKNINDIQSTLFKALEDEVFRDVLINNANDRAKLFSWASSANKLLDFLDKNVKPQTEYSSYSEKYDFFINDLADAINEHSIDDSVVKKIAKCIAANQLQLSNEIPKEKLTWKIEGPFDSSYSLALLNRETARALKAIGQSVSLFSTEGPGDFQPSSAYLELHPDINEMYQDGLHASRHHDVVTRNLYPPRVTEMSGDVNILHHYAWEESGFPRDWVHNFNVELNGITCLSDHVLKIMIDNGVSLPLYTSGCGVDHWDRIDTVSYPAIGKSFKFLHVSSCFPRKGVDILLEAYGNVFTADDDVSLIIKTFDNPHNNIQDLVNSCQAKQNNFPHVVIIMDDLLDGELKSLYEQCNALVAPSKAEGFGLPMAEATLSGLPVITTGWGGQLDFCNSDNSWLVDYTFELADTHLNIYDSVWAKPCAEDLSNKIKDVFHCEKHEIDKKVKKAQSLLKESFTWESVAINLVNQTNFIIKSPVAKPLKIAWVSTWNEKCGIATYSEHLIEQNKTDKIYILAPKNAEINHKDSVNVSRCWNLDNQDNLEELYQKIISLSVDAVIIQMNFYFFDYEALTRFVSELKVVGITVTLTLHSTVSPEKTKDLSNLKHGLDLLDRVIVHTPADLNRLKNIGVINNTLLLPHGVLDKKAAAIDWRFKGKQCIASYGFALPHKGIEELIEAFKKISNKRDDLILLLMNAEHPDKTSAEFILKVKKQIINLNIDNKVYFKTDFLPDEDSLGYLSHADIIAMPYQNTGESSSGAVKMAIASGSRVIVTPLTIFEDVNGAVEYFDGNKVSDIIHGLEKLLDKKYSKSIDEIQDWRREHSYNVISHRLFNVIKSLKINCKRFD